MFAHPATKLSRASSIFSGIFLPQALRRLSASAIEKPANKIECLGHGVGYTVREIVNKFQEVNKVDFDIKYGPRRPGDAAVSVLEDVSKYMTDMYTMDELLKVDTLVKK